MIKSINPNNILITPFVASKGCELSGQQTDDLLVTDPWSGSLTDDTGEVYVGEFPIAYDFVDYGTGLTAPVLNRSCSLALDQQTLDAVIYEEGVSGSGMFYTEQESINLNGSYKRMVWSQIRQAFYNNYRDPTKLFGLENLDINLSGTKRFYAERVRVFTVPQRIFGEKLLEGSIRLVDNALDDYYEITDDSKGNLVASRNLFSKYQVVRDFPNNFASGSTGIDCPLPVDVVDTSPDPELPIPPEDVP
jgi:hypothetical protein